MSLWWGFKKDSLLFSLSYLLLIEVSYCFIIKSCFLIQLCHQMPYIGLFIPLSTSSWVAISALLWLIPMPSTEIQHKYLKNLRSTSVCTMTSGNPFQKHRLGTDWLGSSFAEKAPAVLVDSKLRMSQQAACLHASFIWQQGRLILCCINRSIARRSSEGIIPYKQHLLNYIWSFALSFLPPYSKDIDKLEQVQCRITRTGQSGARMLSPMKRDWRNWACLV